MHHAADAFAAGDYLSAARQYSPDAWQHWASLGLMGHPSDAAAALQTFPGTEAIFFSGVASWIAGDDDRARHVLARCPGEHAQRLSRLIAKDRITVLTQLPWNRRGCWDLLSNLRDPAFQALNVSFHRHDLQNRPYADVMAVIPAGFQPDFYVTEMLEWHLIPPNVRDVGCPVIGHTSDFDLHIQTVVPWLDVFDELIVLDTVEWRDLQSLVRAPVSVFPKVFGVPSQVPNPPQRERDIDVFLSGTLGQPYHQDKDAVVLDILRLPDVRLRIVQGFERVETYYESLADSKMTCTFVRHAGAMPTRGLEALGMGCVVAVQEESALRLFGGESQGIVPYGSETRGPADAIAHVLARWKEYSRYARAGAAMVRREFALERVASQYFRFLTFLAARPRVARTGPEPNQLVQKRPAVQKGWLPSNRFGAGLLMDWAGQSAALIERRLRQAESAQLLNDLARERLLAHYHDPVDGRPPWIDSVAAPLQRSIDRFPAALVPRFNLIRLFLHFGSPDQVRRAIALIDDTIARSPDQWQVDRLDDVLPWDFCPSWFNYRRYFDTLTRAEPFSAEARSELRAVILASVNHYRARYVHEIPAEEGAERLAAASARLDPDFVEYELFYCRLLVDLGGTEHLAEAQRRLARLAQSSTRLLEILDVARRLPGDQQGPWYVELQNLATRFWNATDLRDNPQKPPIRTSLPSRSRSAIGATGRQM